MSDKAKGRVWELDLPHNEKWVLLAMADHADHEGRNIYPGHALTAWKTDYDEDTVIRLVRKLVARGILVLDDPARRPSPSNPYHIEWAACPQKPRFVRPTPGRPPAPDAEKRTAISSATLRKSTAKARGANRSERVNDPASGAKSTALPPRADTPLTVEPLTEPFKNRAPLFLSRNGTGDPPSPPLAPAALPTPATMQGCQFPGCCLASLSPYCRDHGEPPTYRTLRSRFRGRRP